MFKIFFIKILVVFFLLQKCAFSTTEIKVSDLFMEDYFLKEQTDLDNSKIKNENYLSNHEALYDDIDDNMDGDIVVVNEMDTIHPFLKTIHSFFEVYGLDDMMRMLGISSNTQQLPEGYQEIISRDMLGNNISLGVAKYDANKNTVIFVFRGTEFQKLVEWLSNARCNITRIDIDSINEKRDSVFVHSGFYNFLNPILNPAPRDLDVSLTEQAMPAISEKSVLASDWFSSVATEMKNKFFKANTKKIFSLSNFIYEVLNAITQNGRTTVKLEKTKWMFFGHSRGAALANLFHFQLLQNNKIIEKIFSHHKLKELGMMEKFKESLKKNHSLITFSSPKLFYKSIQPLPVEYVNNCFEHCLHMKNNNDPVPRLPIGYQSTPGMHLIMDVKKNSDSSQSAESFFKSFIKLIEPIAGVHFIGYSPAILKHINTIKINKRGIVRVDFRNL